MDNKSYRQVKVLINNSELSPSNNEHKGVLFISYKDISAQNIGNINELY